MSQRLLMGFWQRLQPPFETESEPVPVEVFQNAVVITTPDGHRLVVDRDDMADALERPRPRAA